MTVTGGFDAALQLDERALQRIFTAMHRANPAERAAIHTVDDRHIELLIGRPSISLDPAAPGVRAAARSRVLYRDRPSGAPGDVGLGAGCDMTIRATASVGGGDPAPIDPDTYLVTDWSPTAAGDISVAGLPAADAATVQSRLLDFIHDRHGALELGFLAQAGVSAAGGRVLGRGSLPPVLAVGVDFGGGGAGSGAAITTSVCQQDWAIALAADFVIGQILDGLQADLGALPPPHGAAPVLLDDDGAAQVFLDAFSVLAAPGVIVMAGSVRRESGGPFGTVSATWTSNVTLSLSASGAIVATASQPTVQLNQWYAVVGNWVSGGQIERAVSEAVGAQLAGGLAGAGADRLTGDLVTRLAAAALTHQIPVRVAATAVEVRSDAVVVHGTVSTVGASPPPVARIAVIPGATPQSLVFHAGDSSCPGGDIQALDWDFGDGAGQAGAGTAARIAVEHSYSPGEYSACVTVTDDQGRTARSCLGVQPGVLVLSEVGSSGGTFQFCKNEPDVAIRVTSTGAPIPGATVTISGTGWALSATTEIDGVARLTLDPQQVEQFGLVLPEPSSFHVAAVRVRAAKAGWQARETYMWMIDCDGQMAARLGAIEHRRATLDRLAGYAALRDLLARFGRGRPDITVLTGGGPAPPPDPRVHDVRTIERAVELLTELEDLVTNGSDVLPIDTLFGLRGDEREVGRQIDQRFGELWSRVEGAADAYGQRYGPSPDRPPF